jgi:hypothetical protein
MSAALPIHLLNIDKVSCNPPATQKNRFCPRIFVNDRTSTNKYKRAKNDSRLIVALPRLSTFGIQPFRGTEDKMSIGVQFPMDDRGIPTPETEEALEKLKALDNRLIQYMVANSKTYFNGTLHTKEKMKEMYRGLVRYPKKKQNSNELDYSIPPYVPCKVSYFPKTSPESPWTNLIIRDKNNNTIFTTPANQSPEPLVEDQDFVEIVIHVQSLWVSNNMWGVDIIVTQIQVFDDQGVDTKMVAEAAPAPKVESKQEEGVEEREEEEDLEEVEEVTIDDKTYYTCPVRKHGSVIYEENSDGDIDEDCIVGIYVKYSSSGELIPKFFKQFIDMKIGNGTVIQVERK